MSRAAAQDGIALLVAIMATLVIVALGGGLLLGSTAETVMSTNFERSIEAQYAAEAAMELAGSEVLAAADWTVLIAGLARSSFVDGPPGGTRLAADGTRIDLSAIVNLANCDRVSSCDEGELVSSTSERPWGRNNPRWQLYACGPLTAMMPAGVITSQFYVVVLVADDPAENDDQPAVDGGTPATGEPENAGAGVLVLRAEAFGPRGAHARVDATLARDRGFVAWRPVR